MVESRLISVGERIVVVDDEYHKSISGKVIGFRKNPLGDDVIVIEAEF